MVGKVEKVVETLGLNLIDKQWKRSICTIIMGLDVLISEFCACSSLGMLKYVNIYLNPLPSNTGNSSSGFLSTYFDYIHLKLGTWKCEGKVWLLAGKRHVPIWAGDNGTFYVKFSIEDPKVQSLISLVQIQHSNIHSQLQSCLSLKLGLVIL